MRRPLLLAAALMLALTGLAGAASTYVPIEQRLSSEQRHATGIDTLSPTQLALLNQLLRDDIAQAVAAEKAAPAAPPVERVLVGLEDGPIISRVKGTVSGWAPGTEFALDNGQRWKVLKGEMTLRKPLDSPPIRVVPGVAGRWFLEVDEDLPKARVYRID
jgi:hypothetical protein